MLHIQRIEFTWNLQRWVKLRSIKQHGPLFLFIWLLSSLLINIPYSISDEFHETSHNISSPKWSLEEGYQNSVPVDPETYPYRIFGSGARSGLFALLRLYEQNLEYLCRGPVQGFKILLHTPGEVPQVSKHYFRVPLLQEVLVSVKPNMITTSDGLRHYEPNRRQCFFNSERSLQYFKVYTQRNCELECLTNFTLGYCGCVKFSMPSMSNLLIWCVDLLWICVGSTVGRSKQITNANRRTESMAILVNLYAIIGLLMCWMLISADGHELRMELIRMIGWTNSENQLAQKKNVELFWTKVDWCYWTSTNLGKKFQKFYSIAFWKNLVYGTSWRSSYANSLSE